MQPFYELILNPFAGAAGVNMISIMFYVALIMGCMVAIIERSFHDPRR